MFSPLGLLVVLCLVVLHVSTATKSQPTIAAYYSNINLRGPDLKQVTVKAMNECHQYCTKKTKQCLGFTFTADKGGGGTCHLKKGNIYEDVEFKNGITTVIHTQGKADAYLPLYRRCRLMGTPLKILNTGAADSVAQCASTRACNALTIYNETLINCVLMSTYTSCVDAANAVPLVFPYQTETIP